MTAQRTVAGLVVLAAAGHLADRYTAAMLVRMLVIGLLAVSVALLSQRCGLPSLGQTAPFAVGAYTSGWLATHHHTLGPVLLLASGLAAALFAAATGPMVLRTRGTVFLMVSLAVGELITVASGQWSAITGGTDGMFAIPATRPWPGAETLRDPRDVWLYALVTTVVLVAAVALVLRGPYGLLLDGVRDNEKRLRASGHRTGVYLLVAYVGAGAIAGVGGSLLVTAQRYVSPADVSFDLAAMVLLAVVIGGSVVGALAGAALIVATRDWLSGPWPGHAALLVGGLLIITVYALPGGLTSIGKSKWLKV
jgi:branched-chain amino acid transport system permease protein